MFRLCVSTTGSIVLGSLLLFAMCGEASARIRMYGGPVTGASGGRYYPPGGMISISVDVKPKRSSSGVTGDEIDRAFQAEQERQKQQALSMRSVPFWSGEARRAVLFHPGELSQSAAVSIRPVNPSLNGT